MERKVITIEEIQANPNLNLEERIKKFSQDDRFSGDDLKELAITSIKQEYEFWANNRENISPRTDELLKQILNGHVLSKSEAFEMICADPKKVEEYSKYENLKQRISEKNGITIADFNELCQNIGFDPETTELIKMAFEDRGLFIDQVEEVQSHHK